MGKMLAVGTVVVAFGIVLSLLLSGFDFASIPRQITLVRLPPHIWCTAWRMRSSNGPPRCTTMWYLHTCAGLGRMPKPQSPGPGLTQTLGMFSAQSWLHQLQHPSERRLS